MRPTPKYLMLALIILALISSCSISEAPSKPDLAPSQPAELIADEVGTLTDIDGNIYPILQIGEQIWMGANLMAVRGPNGEPVDYFCYNDEESNCLVYGMLYTLDAAMHGDSGEGAQGICPAGWHIPSMSEWEVLINELGGKEIAGKALKEAGETHWLYASSEGGGESGLNILPSGWFDFTLEYRGQGQGCFLRSSSSPDPAYALTWMLESYSDGIDRGDLHPDDAIPLRCLKD